jgi:hypothetical protein
MLTNNLAKPVTNLRAAVIHVPIGGLWRELLRLSGTLRRIGEGSDFLNGADADPVGLAQGSINGTCLRDPHFGTVDKDRDVGRIGIAVSYEVLRFRLCDGCFEYPAALFGIGNALCQFCRYA